MRKLLTSALIFSLLSTPAFADRYEFDKSHTNIMFRINHLGFSNMIGLFTDYSGGFTFDPQKPEASTIDVTIKPSSVRTSSPELDAHLQKEEFFNSAKFPDIRFVSTGVKVTGSNTGEVTGNVTMLGVTKPATLKVVFNKMDVHPYTKAYIAGFSADATIKRSDFGMNYGIPNVGDEVTLHIETEGVNLDRKAEAPKDQK